MSSLKRGLKRAIKSAQVGMREINISYTGASGDAIGGPDQLTIEEVIDLGSGQYTVVLADVHKAVYGKPLFLKGFSSLTADTNVSVVATDFDRITVQCHVAGGLADADISLCIGVHDWRFEYDR